MATFSNTIHGDNRGQIVQAARDAHVSVTTVSSAEALEALARLRAEVRDAELPPAAREAAAEAIDAMEQELRSDAPDRAKVADRLRSLTGVLKGAGELLLAGTALAGPIGTIAGWVGALV